MRLLSEREAVRNEALLMLIQLASNHSGIQKAISEGGGFEKLFEIVKWEGGSEGGIVVRDCLDLMNALVRENERAQNLFR